MGMFDDIIPAQQPAPGTFDDLIPDQQSRRVTPDFFADIPVTRKVTPNFFADIPVTRPPLKPVTDPALLAQLEGSNDGARELRPVTDPAILAALNAPDPTGGLIDENGVPRPGPVPEYLTPQPRVGDFLKPIFGDHNPIAETIDVVSPAASDVANGIAGNSDRPLLQRAAGAINFGADAQLRALTQGKVGLGDIGLREGAQSAEDFTQNNPGLVNALDVAGSLMPGVGLGAPNLMPEGSVSFPQKAPVESGSGLSEAAAAAERQGISLPRGVSSDSRVVNGLTSYVREVPFAGAPLASAVDASVDATKGRLQSLIDNLGGVQSPETVGSAVRDIATDRLSQRTGELANNIGNTADTFGTATPLEAGEYARDQLSGELSSARKDITNRAASIAGQYGGGSAVSAGESLADNISNWIKRDSSDAAQAAFADVEKQVPPTFKQPLDATRAILGQFVATAREAHTDLPPVYHDVINAVRSPEGLTYRGLETLRTQIGIKLDDHLTPSVEKAPLKQVYGALSQDIQTLLNRAAGPNAVGTWVHANRAFSDLTTLRGNLTKIVGLSGDAAPEAIVDRLTNMAGSTGAADMHRLVQAKAAAGPFAWNELASAIIKKNSDTPEALVRMYSKLSDNGRRILFEGGGRPQLARALDDLVRDAAGGGRVDQMRQSIEPMIGASIPRSGEAILDRIHRMAQSRGSDLDNLRYVRRIVGAKGWGDISGAILRRMGQGKNGFDAEQFRTELSRLSPEGHEILFQSHAPLISTFAEEAGPNGALAEFRGTLSKALGANQNLSGEAIVERLARMAHTAGGSDISTLISIKRTVQRESPEAWDSVSASILDRMGRTKDGFSLAHWRSEWAKISLNGRRALFSQDHIDALNDIDTYGKKLEAAMRGNTSKSAVWGTYAAMAAQLIHAPLSLAAELAGVGSAAWLLAKPARAKATASWLKEAVNAYREPTQINSARLRQLSSVLAAMGQAPSNGSRSLAQ